MLTKIIEKLKDAYLKPRRERQCWIAVSGAKVIAGNYDHKLMREEAEQYFKDNGLENKGYCVFRVSKSDLEGKCNQVAYAH